MEPFLNMRTTFTLFGIIGFILLMCMLHVAHTRRIYPGFRHWAGASFFYFMASILVGLRGQVPDFLSIIMSNACFVITFLLIPYGIALFAARRHPVWPYLLSGLLFLSPFFYFTYWRPDVNARIISFSAIFVLTTAYAIVIFKKFIPPFLKGSNLLLLAAFAGGILWSVLRIVYTVIYEPDTDSFMSSSSFQTASIIVYGSLFTFICFGLCVLNFQRLEHDLLNAKDEVRALEGIIPICASCKMIRDDQGYWNQVEAYIENHADVSFTHSICPDCIEKLYPEHKGSGASAV